MAFDQLLFGLAASIALMLSLTLAWQFMRRRGYHRLTWAAASLALFLITFLLALEGLAALAEPYTPVVGALAPGLLAAGLLQATFRDRGWGASYTGFIIFFDIAMASSIVAQMRGLTTPLLLAIHIPSGVIIFLLPLITAAIRRTTATSSLIGLGGLLMGAAGIALAMLQAGVPLLPAPLLLDVIAPLFLAVIALFAAGILLTPEWGRV